MNLWLTFEHKSIIIPHILKLWLRLNQKPNEN